MAPIASMLPSSLYFQEGLPTSFASGAFGQCTDVHAGPSSSLLSASASTLAQKFRQGCGISAPAAGKNKIALYSPEFFSRACTIGRHRHKHRCTTPDTDAVQAQLTGSLRLPAISWVSACFKLCIV